MAASFALFSLAPNAESGLRESRPAASFDMEGVEVWFRSKFAEADMKAYSPEQFRIESHLCNCTDRPEPHYPYIFVIFSTPKGDLIGRPDRKGFDTVITRLAVRHGERYCDVDAEHECYGSFATPCHFSDARFGAQLAPYFPTCKQPDDAEPAPDAGLTPVRFRSLLPR